MRWKTHPEENYRGFFDDGETLRFTCRPGPILPLRYPEMEDVSLGTLCHANCPYCYASSDSQGIAYPDALNHIEEYYGGLSDNDRPFQVALGGGEPTLHPDFSAILEALHRLNVMPNYSTNAMHLTPEVLEATEQFAGGVAVSCHPHLEEVWRDGLERLKGITRTALHIIVGSEGSAKRFWEIYDGTDGVEHYVALPYQAIGRAESRDVESEWTALFDEAMRRGIRNLAIGAGFYDFLKERPEIPRTLSLRLYEPEVLSGYRRMDDTFEILRRSSFDPRPKFGVSHAR